MNYTITVDAQHSLLTVENLTVGFSYTLKVKNLYNIFYACPALTMIQVRAETTPGFGMYSEEITIILGIYCLAFSLPFFELPYTQILII